MRELTRARRFPDSIHVPYYFSLDSGVFAFFSGDIKGKQKDLLLLAHREWRRIQTLFLPIIHETVTQSDTIM